MLQCESCFNVFEDEFRPWPHLYKNKGRSKKFYGSMDANLVSDLKRIRLDPDREDYENYSGILGEVFGCFGYGIIDSLEYTMKNYLRQTWRQVPQLLRSWTHPSSHHPANPSLRLVTDLPLALSFIMLGCSWGLRLVLESD